MREFDWGARGRGPQVVHDRVLTAANAISALRLAGLPLFVWLMLGRQAYGQALGVLMAVGATDWVDGYVARRFDQVTRLGRTLDPLIDRALIVTAAVTLLLADMLPWWVAALVVGRDVALLGAAALMLRRAVTIPVTRTGKFGTANLLVALPLHLLGNMEWVGAAPLLIAAWCFTAVGLVSYYLAGAQYARAVLAGDRRGDGG